MPCKIAKILPCTYSAFWIASPHFAHFRDLRRFASRLRLFDFATLFYTSPTFVSTSRSRLSLKRPRRRDPNFATRLSLKFVDFRDFELSTSIYRPEVPVHVASYSIPTLERPSHTHSSLSSVRSHSAHLFVLFCVFVLV